MRGCCEAPEQRGQVQEYGEQQQDVGEELESKSQPWSAARSLEAVPTLPGAALVPVSETREHSHVARGHQLAACPLLFVSVSDPELTLFH